MNAEDRIIRAKVQLQVKRPFFSYILLHMYEKADANCPTLSVNRFGRMVYNPEFLCTLSEEELEAVVCHEALHVVLHHMERIADRNHLVWNYAVDLQVNSILVNDRMSLPKGVMIPKNNSFDFGPFSVHDIDKKFAESLYDELYSKFPKVNVSGHGQGQDSKGKGDNSKGKGDEGQLPKRFDEHDFSGNADSAEENPAGIKEDDLEDHWKGVMTDAYTVSKSRGIVPAGMERIVEEILSPKVNWRHVLHKMVTDVLPFDYTWRWPSKKSITTGLYLPSTLRESVEVVVSIDTSGSIGQKELTEFLSEVVGIAKSFENLKMTIIVCDCAIHEVYEVSNGNIPKILDLKISGGGGTSHIPVYRYLEENMPNARLIVNFTDGLTEFPEKPDIDTLWVISGDYGNLEIPFGEIIKLEEE